MAFINDYLTEEEKKKFEQYNFLYHVNTDDEGVKLGTGSESCTIDRENEMYLFHSVNTFERREFMIKIDYFSLVIVKNNIASVAYFDLKNLGDSSEYHKIWKMEGYDLTNVKNIEEDNVIKCLKEALVGYGIYGKIGVSTAKIGFDF